MGLSLSITARRRVVAIGLLLGVAAAAPTASAHHSFAMFDRNKQIDLTGSVRAFQWTNPHIFIEIVVKGDKGPEVWAIEGASPNMLLRQGWRPDTMKPGDQVALVVNPLRDGARGGNFVFARLPNGKTLGNLNSRAPG